MAWVRFKRPFEWPLRPDGSAFLLYRAGRAYSVTNACAAAAVAADTADRMKAPRKGVDPNGSTDGADPQGL